MRVSNMTMKKWLTGKRHKIVFAGLGLIATGSFILAVKVIDILRTPATDIDRIPPIWQTIQRDQSDLIQGLITDLLMEDNNNLIQMDWTPSMKQLVAIGKPAV